MILLVFHNAYISKCNPSKWTFSRYVPLTIKVPLAIKMPVQVTVKVTVKVKVTVTVRVIAELQNYGHKGTFRHA